MVGMFILALQHKDINSAQFVEILKVKATSIGLRVDKLEGAAIFFLLGVKGVMEVRSYGVKPNVFNEE